MISNSINKKFSLLIGSTILILMSIFTTFMIIHINKNLIKELESNLQVQVENYYNMAEIYNDSLEKNALNLMNVFQKSFRNLRIRGKRTVTINGVNTLELSDGFSRVNENFDVVDHFTSLAGAVSSVYVKEKNKFVRITSSLKDLDNKRILLDTIDPNSEQYKSIINKEKFVGLETIGGKSYMSVYAPIIKDNILIGALSIGLDFTKGLESLKKNFKEVVIGDTGYIYIINDKGTVLLDKSLEGQNILNLKDTKNKLYVQEMTTNKNGVIHYDSLKDGIVLEKVSAYKYYKKWNWIIVAGSFQKEFLEISVVVQKAFIIATIIVILILLGVIFLLINKIISSPLLKFQIGLLSFFKYLNKTQDSADKIEVTSNDEIGKMAELINKNIEEIQVHLNEDHNLISNVKHVVNSIGQGTLEKRITANSTTESLNELKHLINIMLTNLEDFVGKDINQLSFVLKDYAQQDFTKTLNKELNGKIGNEIAIMNNIITEILISNQEDGLYLQKTSKKLSDNVTLLSNNATSQAESLEEVASAINKVTVNVDNTSKKAQNMFNISSQTKDSANQGKELATQTVFSMEQINEKVHAINDSIAVIDQISFQTNILSLNAAVEAATAGEAGKGFAVVAQEVRNLASRSAAAAHTIKELVESATQQALSGKDISMRMIEGFEKLEEKINETNHIIDDVASGAKEQTTSMSNISQTINSIDQFTKQNAIVAEETNKISNDTSNIANKIVQNVNKSKFVGKTINNT